jgi:serine/threonine protein kinase
VASPSESSRWREIEELFHAACELETSQRAAFLDQACAGDAELRSEVETLLASVTDRSQFIEASLENAARDLIEHPHPAVLAVGQRFGAYQIIRLLGAGGMGSVSLAQDTRLPRKVALKTLNPALIHDESSRRRFEGEARAASALNHPNILTVFEYGEVEGIHFIASEYVEGVTLRERLSHGALAPDQALDIALQIAAGMSVAHAAGLAHRDIKPENIIIRTDGIVKILDFGIAKLTEGDTAERILATCATEPGMLVGSARYMSPEQARGLPIDLRTDVFSLGTVMYEMFSGRAPFQGETSSDVISEILKTMPPPLETLAPQPSHQIDMVVHKALAKDRDRRYANAGELAEALRACRQNVHRWPALQARGPWIFALAAFLIAATLFFLWRRPPRGQAVAQTRLAILPFRNLKPDPDTDFLGFSLADAVITKLSMVRAVVVRPSSAVDRYRNQTIDPRKVGADLNVDTLLTGTYLRDGPDLRIATQLFNVKSERILWQDTIDLKYEKLLTVQDRVAQQIIQGLELELSPSEAQNLKLDSPVNNTAYEYYLRGVDLYALNDFAAAIRVLERSVSLDPAYALAWAQLGRAYTTNASLQFGGREDYSKAQEAYQRSMALDPALLEPRVYLANLLTDTGRAEEAVPLLRAALQRNPNFAEAHWELGYAYRFAGMLKESVAESETARQHEPSVKRNSSAINGYLYLGDYAKFLASLPAADSAYVLFYRGFGEYYQGESAVASADFDRAFESDPLLLPAAVGKALSEAVAHRNADGILLLKQTEAKIEGRGVSDAEGIYKVAEAYAVLGDRASAVRVFERSIAGGFFCYPYFQSDPLLANVRGEPGFAPALERARLRHEAFRAKFFGR